MFLFFAFWVLEALHLVWRAKAIKTDSKAFVSFPLAMVGDPEGLLSYYSYRHTLVTPISILFGASISCLEYVNVSSAQIVMTIATP